MLRRNSKYQEEKIQRGLWYCWCYNDKYQINLIPIAFWNFDLARYTLTKCFGDEVFSVLHIISGRQAKKQKMVFGKNSFRNPITGKLDRVRKWFIPPEWKLTKHEKRHFLLRIYRSKSEEEAIKKYYKLTNHGQPRVYI